jgi:hypothetical protein
VPTCWFSLVSFNVYKLSVRVVRLAIESEQIESADFGFEESILIFWFLLEKPRKRLAHGNGKSRRCGPPSAVPLLFKLSVRVVRLAIESEQIESADFGFEESILIMEASTLSSNPKSALSICSDSIASLTTLTDSL